MSTAELRPSPGEVFADYESLDATLPEEAQALALYDLFASAPEAFDPMEKALHDFAKLRITDRAPPLMRSNGLRPDFLAVTHIWQPDA